MKDKNEPKDMMEEEKDKPKPSQTPIIGNSITVGDISLSSSVASIDVLAGILLGLLQNDSIRSYLGLIELKKTSAANSPFYN